MARVDGREGAVAPRRGGEGEIKAGSCGGFELPEDISADGRGSWSGGAAGGGAEERGGREAGVLETGYDGGRRAARRGAR